MKRASRLLVAVLVATARPVGADAAAPARAAIEAQYAAMSSAIARKDVASYLAAFTPDFENKGASGTLSLSDYRKQLEQMLPLLADFQLSVRLDSLEVTGDEAVAMNTQTSRYTVRGQKRRSVEKARDTWTRTQAGWRLRRSETLSQTTENEITPLDPQVARAVVAEIKERAIPFTAVEAGSGFDDLLPLQKAIGDARIVALGEASHGTAEFFKMKHRLLEFLVGKMGFTVFAIEANWPESLAVDRYIKTGEGDPKKALAGMYFWTWNTQEVLDMIEWMRAYNKAPGDHPILSFTSFDMQTPNVALQRVEEYLQKYSQTDADAARTLSAEQRRLQEAARERAIKAREQKQAPSLGDDAAAYKALQAQAESLVALFDRKRDALVKASSPAQWRDARQAARIVAQATATRAAGRPGGSGVRDKAMAENVRWLAEEAYPNQKLVLWAHNGHVGTMPIGGAKSMGSHLREMYKDEMYVLGFAFDRGEIRAMPMQNGRFVGGGAQPLPVPPAKPGTGDALLREAGMPRFVLDLRPVPPQSALGRWLGQPHLFRMPGAAWDKDRPDNFASPIALGKTFDGIIYIEESTASKALPFPDRAAQNKQSSRR